MEDGVMFPVVGMSNGRVEVRLPEWVDSIVFDRMGAEHCPAGAKRTFDSNLGATRRGVLTYLGTYFPRSLAESFVVFDSLLSDKNLANALAREGRASVCSVGSGTGGDLLGLVLAIKKRVPSTSQVDIISVEGNAAAHDVMRRVFLEARSLLGMRMSLSLINYVFEPPRPFESFCGAWPMPPKSFDFVISSKMLNELDGARACERPYYEFCSAFSGLLKPTGVLMVLDVTSPNGAGGRWTPIRLNGQVNEFISESGRFKTILPLICNRFEDGCGRSCYTQSSFYVSYRNVTNECSKVCYRVIGPTELADKLSGSVALWSSPITEDNRAHCQGFNGVG